MSTLTIFRKNIKWRFHNAYTIVITILQPILWLILYSSVATQTMKNIAIPNYSAFIFPGLIILVSFSTCSSGGIMNYLMKTDGSFYRILIAPIKRNAIVLGQILETICCSFLEIMLMFICSIFLSVRLSTSFLNILLSLLLITLVVFFISSCTYSISLCLPNEVIYETVMNAIVLPIFFLSSALFPTDQLTGLLKILIMINPFTHAINILRSLLLTSTIDYSYVLFVILLFSFLACLGFMWALKCLKRETNM